VGVGGCFVGGTRILVLKLFLGRAGGGLEGGRFFGYRAGSALSGVYYFLEHVLGAVDEDLGCARYSGCGVQFVSAIP